MSKGTYILSFFMSPLNDPTILVKNGGLSRVWKSMQFRSVLSNMHYVEQIVILLFPGMLFRQLERARKTACDFETANSNDSTR